MKIIYPIKRDTSLPWWEMSKTVGVSWGYGAALTDHKKGYVKAAPPLGEERYRNGLGLWWKKGWGFRIVKKK